jgi:CBS domain-containing protein
MDKPDNIKDRRVKDIMVPLEEYPCVTDAHTLRQAIQEMGKAQILSKKHASLARAALVFDKSFRKLLGVLRRRDIMRGLEPRFLDSRPLEYTRKLFDIETDPNLSELSYDKIIQHVREQAERLVGEVMMPIKATIDSDDHIIKAMYEMVYQNTSLLPVLENENVVGVIRSVDLLNEIVLFLDL